MRRSRGWRRSSGLRGERQSAESHSTRAGSSPSPGLSRAKSRLSSTRAATGSRALLVTSPAAATFFLTVTLSTMAVFHRPCRRPLPDCNVREIPQPDTAQCVSAEVSGWRFYPSWGSKHGYFKTGNGPHLRFETCDEVYLF
jgi:hypothetical protein